jgi:phosphoribosylamine--glycine ligase
MKILIVGSGGREHTMAWKCSQSPLVEKIFCAPGNGGTHNEDKCENVNLDEIDDLLKFALDNNIGLTIVGPEVPLCDGIVDKFKEKGLKIFGPGKKAALLEGSKAFSKEFMEKYQVKTAEYAVFKDDKEALNYLEECRYPVVIKADGLAAGKGVAICRDYSEAEEAIKSFMVEDIFKGAGKKIVIEEFLEGVEASILSITDGETIIPFISSKDHKQIYDDDLGPNTGGMGTIAPNPYCSEEVLKDFEKDIMLPTLNGIKEEKMDFVGIIFFGLMICKNGVYLLEYNVRMGDPETQVVLPLMKSDFVDLMLNALENKLSSYKVDWNEGHACCIVAASGGYPAKYEKGYEIKNIENIDNKYFVAGAKYEEDKLVTSGGRVLAVTAVGSTLQEAREKAYNDIGKIDFKNMYYRKDIGKIK